MQGAFVWRAFGQARVSVPSTGRSGLQRVRNLSSIVRFSRFSTLYGSKWVATAASKLEHETRLCVSVPSTGRSGLQQTVTTHSFRPISFSTLYGSKWVATSRVNLGTVCLQVSVPSTGRSGLQLRNLSSVVRFMLSFSTLYGSKWVATDAVMLEVSASLSFSTLYGSKWVATICLPKRLLVTTQVSVPSTGRSGLQRSSLLAVLGTIRVSVPSTGRSGLQPTTTAQPDRRFVVSVPSTGRSGLQLDTGGSNSVTLSGFSTLYGSKWVATEKDKMKKSIKLRFSTLYGSKWVATCFGLVA